MEVIIIDVRGNKTKLYVQNDLSIREVKRLSGFQNCDFWSDGEVMRDEFNLSDNEVENGDIIIAMKPPQEAGGHICPYGCGREIPDNYKGCTELLREHPNFFKSK